MMENTCPHLKFPSLEQFNNIFSRETYGEDRRSLTYGLKIKLHGMNAAIRICSDGTVFAQSRTGDLSVDDDMGFFHFVDSFRETWSTASQDETVTFFGEWAGPRIKKGDAVQKTDARRFYIFALGIGAAAHHQSDRILTPAWMITCPQQISGLLPDAMDRDMVRILPWEGADIIFDFAHTDQVERALSDLNDRVNAVAVTDPYILRTFGIDHKGEGFVLVPKAARTGELSTEAYSRSAFKAKTEKHRVRKQARPASMAEPLPPDALSFIETFCTPARLSQALDEVCGGTADVRMTGGMIAWMTRDIEKEAATEIAALPVPFSRLKGDIANATRTWFMARLKGDLA